MSTTDEDIPLGTYAVLTAVYTSRVRGSHPLYGVPPNPAVRRIRPGPLAAPESVTGKEMVSCTGSRTSVAAVPSFLR